MLAVNAMTKYLQRRVMLSATLIQTNTPLLKLIVRRIEHNEAIKAKCARNQ